MIISSRLIRSLIDEQKLIEPGFPYAHSDPRGWHAYWAERFRVIEGCCYDFALDGIYELASSIKSELGEDHRVTPATFPLPPIEDALTGKRSWRLMPGYYLAQTNETVNMPNYLSGLLDQRTTVFRGGARLSVGAVQTGYKGKLTVGLEVFDRHCLQIWQGARFLSCRFIPVIDKLPQFNERSVDKYLGIWSGDKRSTEGQVERGY